jgi:hypothetical protein
MSPLESRDVKKDRRDSHDEGRSRPEWNKGRRAILIIGLAIICGAVILVAMMGNSSTVKLQVSEGDLLRYSITGYESGKAVSGAMTIEVTDVGTNSFTATYSITIDNNVNKTDLVFEGASVGWSSNVDDVVGRISGSGSEATAGNTTSYSTLFGTKELTAHAISTTSKMGKSVLFQYWLDAGTRCPYLLAMTYGNGDVLTFSLVYTNISAFK